MPAPKLKPTARSVVARALARAAEHYPDLDPVPLDTAGLDAREARLAVAIHRTALQRWITIEHFLDRHLRQPFARLEPALRGVLLSAGAQLLFMDRLPNHAVVDESVELARTLVRPGAAPLVNAVLRKLAEATDAPVHGKPWTPAANRLPIDDGYAPLRSDDLPSIKPEARDIGAVAEHLSIATSHPKNLVHRWVELFGVERATQLCRQGSMNPPLIVAVEPGFTGGDAGPEPAQCEPHEQLGFVVWCDTHERLVAFLEADPRRRVQDPAAARAVAATASLAPSSILDACAGRGTKSRQLALTHPAAIVIASDPDEHRLADLRRVAEREPRIRAVDMDALNAALPPGGVDLIVLDVPCSNTGVLARRIEARYRFNRATLRSLVQLQRQIITDNLPRLRRGGHLLYSTCSIDPAENHEQTRWIIERVGASIISEDQTLPDGHDTSWHDGAYHVLLALPS